MTKVLTDPQHYTDIANAIREKNGSTTAYKPSEMAEAIAEIETGGDVSDEDLSPFTIADKSGSFLARITSVDCSKANFLPTGNSYDSLFSGMSSISKIKNFAISEKVININNMLYGTFLKSVDAFDFDALRKQAPNIQYASAFGRMIGSAWADVSLTDFHWDSVRANTSINLYDNQEKTLDLSGWTFPLLTYPPSIHWNRSLTKLTIDGWDFSNCTSLGSVHFLAQDYKLATIEGDFTGLGTKHAKVSFSELKYQTATPHVGFDTETVTRIINALATRADSDGSLVFSLATEANVTDEQVEAATAKGWTISYA